MLEVEADVNAKREV